MNKQSPASEEQEKRGWRSLTPLLVFFAVYVGGAVWLEDFYKMPVSVAFLAAAAWGIALFREVPLTEKLEIFSRGAAHRDIMMMIWIFLMAGAFAESAKQAGAINSVVNLTLHFMPPGALPAGLFLAACLVSLSIGTSVGTIVALMPVAVALATRTSVEPAIIAGIVVGGAFFGDNLSFISDTTIASTRTQGCSMRDKFMSNIRIAVPAAIVAALLYVIVGWRNGGEWNPTEAEWSGAAPYLLVLALALFGVNVLLALTAGLGAIGVLFIVRGQSLSGWVGAMGDGMLGMGELIIVTLLAGGLLGLIRHYGGMDCVIRLLLRHIRGRRMAELGIAFMVFFSNLCTANNTVAILTVGDIARHLSQRYHIPSGRSASLLDTFSCLVQGVIPYGAQLLMAAQLGGVSAVQIIPYLYYPMVLGGVALVSILWRRKVSSSDAE